MTAPTSKINLWKIAIPVIIGVSVSVYLIATNFNPDALRNIQFSRQLIVGLLLAAVTVVLRDGAFMYKIRLCTGNKMTWRKTFQTIVMWEFMACITPKIGEAPFVIFVLKNSGLTYGKTIAVIMLNSLFDNLAFVAVFTLLYFVMGHNMLLLQADCPDLANHPILQAIRSFADKAWIGYALMLTLCVFLSVALFVLPHSTKLMFYRISRISLFSKFKDGLRTLGNDIETTASEFKNQSLGFWIKFSISNLINWVARFLLACSLLYAFSNTSLNMLEVFARQYVLWIFTSVPSTPGASGVAEISFIALNCEFMQTGLSAAIALVWRMYSYYLYLIVGMALLPKWAKQVTNKN